MKTGIAKSSPRRSTQSRRPKLAQVSDIQEGFAKSSDGTKIWYKSMGQGKPAIIFCNGLGCSTFYWKHIYTYFKKTHQVVLFDWRGHGKSDTPKDENNITIDRLRDDLNTVMRKLRIKKAVLAGHSMGTQVLYKYYEKYPQKVSALIPCFGTFGQPMDTFYNSTTSKYVFSFIYLFNHTFPRLANTVGYLVSKNPFWFQMGSALKMMNPGLADKKVLKEYIEHFTSVDSVFLAKMAKSMQDYTAELILKKIKAPTLILAAEKDTFTPVWLSKKMHHLIPKSEIMVIKKATHVALIEQPALINLRIEKFIHERV